MDINFIVNHHSENSSLTSIIYRGQSYSYFWLLNNIELWFNRLQQYGIQSNQIISLTGDFSPNSMAIFLALIKNNNIIVPLNYSQSTSNLLKKEIAEVNVDIKIDGNDNVTFESLNKETNHPLLKELIFHNVPGLVLFTSGTSGQPKAAVHDLTKLLEKFRTKRKALRTINFLLFDHWGGLNTMFHSLSNRGVVLALRDRNPESVCEFIQNYKIELLPASPTFLNLLLISEAYEKYDLSSLELITYGTEPMPASTLEKLNKVFKNIKFQQTYGLIELGVLRSKSKNDNSLWVKIGGEGFETRVVDGILQIKADSAMLGYLNAPSPFTEDGFFITGDAVEVDGEYFKILGRKSELINVGGEKVYPNEVESIIQEIENIAEVTVYGEKNPLTGNIVCARIRLKVNEDQKQLIIKIKRYCKERLQSFKVPVKIIVEENILHNQRFKKIRKF